MNDPFDLQRFVDAQEAVYSQVIAELRRGRETSHWMWFIFPQIEGLGHSPIAEKYAITGLAEAKAYLNHRVVGQRLVNCIELMLGIHGRSINQILGYPDDLKFRSSMTLFAEVSEDISIFHVALDKYFDGEPDPLTIELL